MTNFAEVFNSLLKESNLSIRDFSNKVKISHNQICKYLKGLYEPSLNNALKLAEYFSCSLDFLFGLDKSQNNSTCYNQPNIEKFLERFTLLIKSNNTNYNRISKHTFLNRNTLYSWQHTKTFPKMGIVVKLANELHCPIEYLIGRID